MSVRPPAIISSAPVSYARPPRAPSPPPAPKRRRDPSAVHVQPTAVAPVSQIKIRKDHHRVLKAPMAKAARKKGSQLCPRCGQPVPQDELERHMRIELLDPKWREQREKEVEWKRTRNLDDAAVAKVLSNISEFRTDIFDEKEPVDVRKKLKELESAQATRELQAWDGHTATARHVAEAAVGGLSYEERQRDMLRRRGQLVEGPTVGVQVPDELLERAPRRDEWEAILGPGAVPPVALAYGLPVGGMQVDPAQRAAEMALYAQQTERYARGGYDASWYSGRR
ncbi:Pre-mRNA splicing factor PRP21 like protein-domain-containing protein [Hyaloraphidium curvatum]|nr:Pre-mRNA splicing factor PRP21 like protein-domain-containing protein [Hyaloraphidium curvatum]